MTPRKSAYEEFDEALKALWEQIRNHLVPPMERFVDFLARHLPNPKEPHDPRN